MKAKKYYAVFGKEGFGYYNTWNLAKSDLTKLSHGNSKGFTTAKEALLFAIYKYCDLSDSFVDIKSLKPQMNTIIHPEYETIDLSCYTTYYGVVGDNGFGIYDDDLLLDESLKYLTKPKVKEYTSLTKASEKTVSLYNTRRTDNDMDGLYLKSLDSIKLNYIYYGKKL